MFKVTQQRPFSRSNNPQKEKDLNKIILKRSTSKDVEKTYSQMQSRTKRAISMFQQQQKKEIDTNILMMDSDHSDFIQSNLQRKVLLYYPEDVQKNQNAFQSFKDLKMKHLHKLPRHLYQIDDNIKKRHMQNLQVLIDKYSNIKQQPQVNINPEDVLHEVWHNRNMQQRYEKTMSKLQEQQYNVVQNQFRQQKLMNVQYEERSVSSEMLKQMQQRIFKKEVMVSEKIRQQNKILSDLTKPFVTGQVSSDLKRSNKYNIPDTREGGQIVKCENGFAFLLGGYSHREHREVNIFDLDSFQWNTQRIQIIKQNEMERPLGCYFQAFYFNKTIYVFGGERHDGGRRNTNELFICKNNKWEQIVYGGDYLEPRKDFSASLVSQGDYLVIIGGIGNDSKYLSNINVIDIAQRRNTHLYPQIISNKVPNLKEKSTTRERFHQKEQTSYFQDGIAYHSSFTVPSTELGGPDMLLTNDYKKRNQKREQDKYKGIFIFGGKNKLNESTKNLYFMQIGQLPHTLQIIETQGKSPEASHSFAITYSSEFQMAVFHGGTNDQKCFNDMHLLLLEHMLWVQVKLIGANIKPRFGHYCLIQGTQIVIFGGVSEEGFLTFEPYVIDIDQTILPSKNISAKTITQTSEIN